MKPYYPPESVVLDFLPGNPLLEGSIQMDLKDSSSGFNRDNNSADWLSNKKVNEISDSPIWDN